MSNFAMVYYTIEVEVEISDSGELLEVFTNGVSIKHALKKSEQRFIKEEAVAQNQRFQDQSARV